MALTNIEYGSLASSETMNKNFMYLDDKIAETSDSIMTSISSILSNIATINARLNDISEGVDDSVETLTSTIEEYKTKTKLLVNKASMVPDWKNASKIEISKNKSYTVPSNGYLLLLPSASEKGALTVNKVAVTSKVTDSVYDNSSQLMVVPVFDGDIASSDITFSSVYFLPAKEVSLDDF